MKILHISFNTLNELSGISKIVPELVEAQNNYTDLESQLLIIGNKSNEKLKKLYILEQNIKK